MSLQTQTQDMNVNILCSNNNRFTHRVLKKCSLTSQSGGEQEVSPVFLNDVVSYFLQAWPSPQKPDVMDEVGVKGHGSPIAFLPLRC